MQHSVESRDLDVDTSSRARAKRRREKQTDIGSRLDQLPRTLGNQATNYVVQKALVVGRADDPAEQAADELADLVGHTSERAALAVDGTTSVRRSQAGVVDPLGGQPASDEVASHVDRARGTGHPVSAALRQRVQDVLGDVSSVRLHDDERSNELSNELGASAFTVGQDIFFAKGQHRPGTEAGDRLLVHELAHTAQQRDGVVRRRVNFNHKRLKGLTSFKGWFNNSSFNQIVSTYAEYEKVSDLNAAMELQLLTHLNRLLHLWDQRRVSEGASKREDLSEDDQQKVAVLSDLAKAVTAEIPVVQERVAREKLVTDIGLPAAYAGEMSVGDVSALLKVNKDLGTGDIAAADAGLTALRRTLGDGPVNLIRSMLMRNHIGMVNPAMANVFNDPKYALSDTGEIASGAAKAQQLATDRISEIDQEARRYPTGKPVAMGDDEWVKIDVKLQEGKLQKPVLANLRGAATVKRAAPENKKAMGKLSDDEVSAILGYSTNLYGKYNAPLRRDVSQLGADQAALTKLAVSALNKLTAYSGTVYRHGANFPGYAKLNRVGAVVVDMAFLSTAREQKGCVSAAESHEVLEVITSRSGRDISQLSAFGKGEAEVLFRPGSRFRVTKVVEKAATGDWPDDVTARFANETTKKASIQLVVYKEEV